jgi:hypothetical protein
VPGSPVGVEFSRRPGSTLVAGAALAWALLLRGRRLTRPRGAVLLLAYLATVPLLLRA